ncbi:MAG TPA: prolyl oligopeptidase family serine peptidase [Gemmatimonadaceae bacterium]|nr:prolyl oligopeptidase family serine peptidase [Gemmatimonadaceae bacterium]
MRHVTLFCALLLGACMSSHSAPPTKSSASHVRADGASTSSTMADDPHVWLEDIEGERAMQWVKAHNATSLGTLQGDPRYEKLHADALRIVEATDRIAMPEIRGRTIYNFWQDPAHVRGILRRTTLESYRGAKPEWELVLDVDALSAREGANWVYHGTTCLRPEERRCLLALSNGGKDAEEMRELDLETKRFVDDGFRLPESKGSATWIDENTLLVWRDFGPGTLTKSGYPFVVKRLRRGQPLEQAVEVFRGAPEDVSANAFTLRDADGRLQAVIATRNLTFYEDETWLLRDDGPAVRLPFPTRNSIRGLVDGQLVFTTEIAWNGFETGDLLAYDLAALKADPGAAKPQLILRPGAREAIEGVTVTRNTLVVNLSENVKGAAYVYRHGASGWTHTKLALPANATIGLGSSSKLSDELFLTVSSYLLPNSLWLADVASGKVEKVKSMPERFDASALEMTQYEAMSADGTRVPYFVVGPRGMPLDGSNPTVLYGYGGYQVSLLPGYSGTVGKLWLESGGVYVVANTRGGGEFGPAWHQAAQGENRHRAHEDFAAVAQDLISRRITSPRRLGIMGGSQGGLFMGVAMTQHPELFNAAVIQVPLFDMMRFHKLLAGASWIAEYGNPDVPEERAWIAKYSPYQALKAGRKYPEPFIHTSTKDDRVHPGHARKAVARLEELGSPVLFYENTDGGHSAAANLKESAKRIALEWTYFTRKLKDDRLPTP